MQLMKYKHEIGIAVIVTIIVVFGNVQQAEAEIFSLTAENGKMNVSVINERLDTVVLLHEKNGWSVHFDVKIKEYKSGGFSLRNSQSGLAVFAHPVGENNQYKVLILTSEGSQRYISQLIKYNIVEDVQSINKTETEPSVLVGADISKYDVPTNTTRPADSRK